MTSEKVLKRSVFPADTNNNRFLPYEKNLIENVKSTLYENLDYLYNVGQVGPDGCGEWGFDNSTYRFFEYVPFEQYDGRGYYHSQLCNQEKIDVFKFLKLYRIRAIFNISESTTVKEAKDIFLSPLIDHLLDSPNILGTMFSINRISTEQISLELFIFCDPTISEDELGQMNQLLEKILAKNIW